MKFALEHEKQRSRPMEHLQCQLLAITESIFWLMGEPYVLINMKFKHVQNVPVGKRFVQMSKNHKFSNASLSVFNFRQFVHDLPAWRKLTRNQEILVSDTRESNETLDNMSVFSLRPPELLCIKSVKQYCQWFNQVPNEHTASQFVGMYNVGFNAPFLNCQGCLVKVHPKAVNLVCADLQSNSSTFNEQDLERSQYVTNCLFPFR